MTEAMTMTRKIPEINSVEGFEPTSFARTLTNDDGTQSLYLDVKYRMLWFRLANPNGKIDSEIVHADGKSAVVCCRLYADKADPADQYIAKSMAQRFFSEEKYGDRFLEIAETAAIGRALASAGYGTQFCGNTDLGGNVIADAPMEIPFDADTEIHPQAAQAPVMQQPVIAAEPVAPIAAPVQQVAPAPTKQPTTLDEWVDALSVEEAKQVTVDVGHYSGTRLGDIAIQNPADLEWYVRKYAGRNLKMKAAATVLMRAALERAS